MHKAAIAGRNDVVELLVKYIEKHQDTADLPTKCCARVNKLKSPKVSFLELLKARDIYGQSIQKDACVDVYGYMHPYC